MIEAIDRYNEIRSILLNNLKDIPDSEYNLDHTRKFPYPIWRIIIADLMRREGYSFTTIGKCMNKTHGTLYVQDGKLQEILNSNLKCNKEIHRMYAELESSVYSTPINEDKIIITAKVEDIKHAIKMASDKCNISEDALTEIINNIKTI